MKKRGRKILAPGKEVHKTNKNNLKRLVNVIQEANRFFLDQVQKQVNTSLTLRNWIVGYYIVEYEQDGQDRAEYGEQLFQKLAEHLKKTGIKGLSFTTLHLCKQFYEVYPQILQSLPEELLKPEDIFRNPYMLDFLGLASFFVPERMKHWSNMQQLDWLIMSLYPNT